MFQAGEQNLEKVTIQNAGSYQLMRERLGKYPGLHSAGSVPRYSTVHKARVSDFYFILFFATGI